MAADSKGANERMTDTTVRFSVVIPAYNAGLFIDKTLDSVRKQTFTDYEVLVTDDGSTDNTAQVLKEYQQQYQGFPLKLATQENKGIGGARNNGLLRAKGEYIAFLDADDGWCPEKLERMADYLYCHDQVDVAYHDEIEIRRDGSQHLLSYSEVPTPVYEHLLFKGNRLSTSATVVRRELAQRVGGFSESKEFNSAEDYEFWLRLAWAGARFGHVAAVLGQYNRVEGSITQKNHYHYKNIGNVIKHHFELLRKAGNYAAIDTIEKRRMAEHLATYARSLSQSGDRQDALRKHLQSIKTDPGSWKCYVKYLMTLLGH